MKKIVLMVLSLLVVSMFLVSCAPSEVELVDEDGNVVGEAVRFNRFYKVKAPTRIVTAPSTSGTISKGDLFLLPAGIKAPEDTSTIGEILEYKGADKQGVTNPQIKFKLWSTGESLIYSAQNNQATIKLGGKSFKIALVSDNQDSPIQIDFNGDGTLDTVPTVSKLYNLGLQGVKGLGVCDVEATLLEGETQTFTANCIDYEMTLMYVDNTQAKFSLNGEITDVLRKGDSWRLADGTSITLNSILYQSYAGGIHSATFCLK